MKLLIALLLLAGTLGAQTYTQTLCFDGDTWSEEACKNQAGHELEARIAKLEAEIALMQRVLTSLMSGTARASGETWRDWMDRVHPEVEVRAPGCFGIPCPPPNENRPTEWICQKDGKEIPCGSLK